VVLRTNFRRRCTRNSRVGAMSWGEEPVKFMKNRQLNPGMTVANTQQALKCRGDIS
jgi:hypothetical protein